MAAPFTAAYDQVGTGPVAHDASSATGLLCRPDGDTSSHTYIPWHTKLGDKATNPETFTYPFDVSISPSGTENQYDVSFRLSEAADKQMHAADGTPLKDGTKIILKVKDIATGYTHQVYNVDISQDYDKGTRTVDTKITTSLPDFKVSAKVFGQSAKVQEKFHYPGGTKTGTISHDVVSGSALTLTVHHGLDSTGNPVTSQYTSASSNPVTHVSEDKLRNLKSVSGMDLDAIGNVKFFQTANPVMCLVSEKSFKYHSDTAPDVTVDAKNPDDSAGHYGTGVRCTGPGGSNGINADSSHYYPWIDSEKSADDDYETPLGFSIAPRSDNDGIYDISFSLPTNDSRGGANLLEQLVAKDHKLVLKLKNPYRLADTYQVFEVPHGHIDLDENSPDYGRVSTSITTDLKYFDLAARIYGQSVFVKEKDTLGLHADMSLEREFVLKYTILKVDGHPIFAEIPYDYDTVVKVKFPSDINDYLVTRGNGSVEPFHLFLKDADDNRGVLKTDITSAKDLDFGILSLNGKQALLPIETLQLKPEHPVSCLVSEKSLKKRYATPPQPPSDLAVTPGFNKVELSWSAPAVPADITNDLTDYVVEYSSNAGILWHTFPDGISTATSATVTGLEQLEYSFRVAAMFSGSAGSPSVTVTGTPFTVPDPPSGLDVAALQSSPTEDIVPGYVLLTWNMTVFDGGLPITDYKIEHSSDSGSTWHTFPDGISTATSATVTGLNIGVLHNLRVYAVNEIGHGPASDTVGFVLDDTFSLTIHSPSSESASDTVGFVLSDATKPELVLKGPNPYYIPINTDYVEHGYTATDNLDGDVEVETAIRNLDTSTVGSYFVTYTATDDTGNSVSKDRAVYVYENAVYGKPEPAGSHPYGSLGDRPDEHRIGALAFSADPASESPSDGVFLPPTNYEFITVTVTGKVSDHNRDVDGMPPDDDIRSVRTYQFVNNDADLAYIGSFAVDYIDGTFEVPLKGNGRGLDAGEHKFRLHALVESTPDDYAGAYRDFAVTVGNETPSKVVDVQVPDAAGAPLNLVAAPGDGQVELTWDAPAVGAYAVSDYHIHYRQKASGSWQEHEPSVTSIATTAIITGLTNGQEYSFRVYVTNSAGTGTAFAEATAIPVAGTPDVTPPAVAAPGKPTGLTATPHNVKVELSWNAPADDGGSPITDYKVEYSNDGGSSWLTFDDGIGSGTTATVTSLTNDNTYSFRVSATNLAGEGDASDVMTATPAAVLNVAASCAALTLEHASLDFGRIRSDGLSGVAVQLVRGGDVSTPLTSVSLEASKWTGTADSATYDSVLTKVKKTGAADSAYVALPADGDMVDITGMVLPFASGNGRSAVPSSLDFVVDTTGYFFSEGTGPLKQSITYYSSCT